MIRCTEYDSQGKFTWMHTFQDDATYRHNLATAERRECGLAEGHWPGGAYFMDFTSEPPMPSSRPTQTTALSGLTLSGLPVPCTLWIDHDSYAVDEATVELELPIAGTYRLRVEAWPYLDWEGSVTV